MQPSALQLWGRVGFHPSLFRGWDSLFWY